MKKYENKLALKVLKKFNDQIAASAVAVPYICLAELGIEEGRIEGMREALSLIEDHPHCTKALIAQIRARI